MFFISFLVKQKIELGEKFKVLITQPRIDPWSGKSDTNLEYYEIFKDLTNEELRTNQYDFVITPETYFSEGYGENVDYFKYSKLHDSLSDYLNDFSNTNLISGIQFYKLYQNQIENLNDYWAQLA